ncbi:hypothetical protein [Nostoc sp. LEGE 12450]|uniref:hypothetical protein n=1 Tax=Nostoc sp. LEGE 12450 TaxID=1828643 RepID=UPI001D1513CC|nr:hypothetical protein [Nostoc sp. LEGE 12450]
MTDPHKSDSLYASLKLTSGAIAFLTALTFIFSSLFTSTCLGGLWRQIAITPTIF